MLPPFTFCAADISYIPAERLFSSQFSDIAGYAVGSPFWSKVRFALFLYKKFNLRFSRLGQYQKSVPHGSIGYNSNQFT